MGGIENILLTSTEDARILAEGYTAPIGKTLTYALNSGWATSAKTHKKLGFGLTIGAAIPLCQMPIKFYPNRTHFFECTIWIIANCFW
ncbi:MAG: hypothetical protein CM15mP59_1570 [Flavobacteriaceae bacterium]|nr:MAG: hypothetical protein CM15mP59_1570 [Flavobacteriaceae bacterium]